MSHDDEKTDIFDLAQEWGWDKLHRVQKIFGSQGSPDAKPIAHNIKKYEVGNPTPDKRNKGGIVKALDSYAAVVRLRLEFLQQTIDENIDQHIARAKLAQKYKCSKKRVSNLTVAKKPPTPKK